MQINFGGTDILYIGGIYFECLYYFTRIFNGDDGFFYHKTCFIECSIAPINSFDDNYNQKKMKEKKQQREKKMFYNLTKY